MPPVREKTRVDTRDKRRERLQGCKLQRVQVAEGASSAPHLARSSAVSIPGRNKCLGTHCILIEQEETEDSFCQMFQRVYSGMKDRGEDREVRTEQKSDKRRREEKWQTCWCCLDQQKACQMVQASANKLEQTGPAEKERVASVPQREQLESTPEPPLPKRKEQSRLSRVPDHEEG